MARGALRGLARWAPGGHQNQRPGGSAPQRVALRLWGLRGAAGANAGDAGNTAVLFKSGPFCLLHGN